MVMAGGCSVECGLERCGWHDERRFGALLARCLERDTAHTYHVSRKTVVIMLKDLLEEETQLQLVK